MSHLYDLSGLISSLDIMLSLTKVSRNLVSTNDEPKLQIDLLKWLFQYSINSNGCCPSFSAEMSVIDGIHPLLEYSRCKTTPIPNGVVRLQFLLTFVYRCRSPRGGSSPLEIFFLNNENGICDGSVSLVTMMTECRNFFSDCQQRVSLLCHHWTEHGRKNYLSENDSLASDYGTAWMLCSG